MAHKLGFLSQLSGHLEKVRNKRRGYILCGGWELMAHHADAEDAGNSKTLPGLSASEGWLLDLYDGGYADAFSLADPEPGLIRGGLMATMPAACARTPKSSQSFW